MLALYCTDLAVSVLAVILFAAANRFIFLEQSSRNIQHDVPEYFLGDKTIHITKQALE